MKNFVKRYRFLLILAVLILVAVGALASMSGRSRRKEPRWMNAAAC